MKLSQLEIQQTLTNSKDIQKGRIKVDAPKTEAGPDQRAAKHIRGTQREYSSKPLKHIIVKRI